MSVEEMEQEIESLKSEINALEDEINSMERTECRNDQDHEDAETLSRFRAAAQGTEPFCWYCGRPQCQGRVGETCMECVRGTLIAPAGAAKAVVAGKDGEA